MLTVIAFLFVFCCIISLLLGLSIGISFLLSWLFPNISFEIGMVVGAICSSFSFYLFSKIATMVSNLSYLTSREYDEDWEENEEEEVVHVVPAKSKRTNKRRKR